MTKTRNLWELLKISDQLAVILQPRHKMLSFLMSQYQTNFSLFTVVMIPECLLNTIQIDFVDVISLKYSSDLIVDYL